MPTGKSDTKQFARDLRAALGMNYRGFIASLKKKIANTRVDKVSVDTRLMGFEFARSVTREIRRMSYDDQNGIVQRKVVIIRTDGKVVGIDR